MWNRDEVQKNLFEEMLRMTALAIAEQDENKKNEYLMHARDQLKVLNGNPVQVTTVLN